jgi:tetratricopeptide (TPR) repeat protein
MPSLAEALQHAAGLYRAGRWAGAERLCRSILQLHPQQLDAITLLGIIAAQTQRAPQALELFGRLVTTRPDDPSAHNNYGNVLRLLEHFEEALQSYDRALRIKSDFAEAHNNRGVALHQLRRFAEALESYQRALQLKPDYAEAHGNRGATLQELGRLEEALRSHERALQLQPDYIQAHSNRGVTLLKLGRLEEALQSYERTLQIKPDHAEAHNNRGAVLQKLGRLEEALQSCERALKIKPDYPEAHNNRGVTLQKLGRSEEALKSYERALQIQPDYAEVHNNRAVTLQEIGRVEAALHGFECTLQLKPDYAEAHNNRGIMLQKLGRLEDALQSHDCALRLKSDYAEAYGGRGSALQELGRLDEALQSYQRALQLKRDCAETYISLGVWHYMRNEPEAAVANFNRAIALRPDLASAYMNRAYAALLAGDFASGWADHEWRWKDRPQMVDPRYPDRTLWLGRETLNGKTMVLHSEQGAGDTLQFARYAKQVADLGATVILEVESQLATVLADLEGVSQLVVRGERLPAFDYHCPLISLPLAFATSLSTIPARVPYLAGDRVKTRYWKERLGPRTKPRVGLVWSGGFRPDQPKFWPSNKRRNVPLARMAPLRNADITFYSLQKGQPAESELMELKAAGWQGPELIDFTESLHDFSDTAALIENLDLVISVDTSVAHLAGALAKPVWIMNRFDTCWRWLLNRDDSPWYPTARLYRQQRAGDWDSVVERIRIDLLQTRFDR